MPGGMPGSYESASSMPDADMDVEMNGVNSADPTLANGRGSNSKKQDTPGRRAIFMVLRQKYLELIEAGQTVRALKVLRLEAVRAVRGTEWSRCLEPRDWRERPVRREEARE